MVATYIGVALYIILYLGYSVFERFYERKLEHFVPTSEIDFVTDAVWKPGEGAAVPERDYKEKQVMHDLGGGSSSPLNIVWSWGQKAIVLIS